MSEEAKDITTTDEQPKHIAERVPVEVFAVVEAFMDDPKGLVGALEFEGVDVTREEARQLIRYLTDEEEADLLAGAPSGTTFLKSQADTMLRDELKRLQLQQRQLQAIASKPEDDEFGYRIKGSSEILSPFQARLMMESNMKRILEIKKALAEDIKAENAGKGGDKGDVNLQFNLGEIVTEANARIKDAGFQRVPTVIDAQP